MKTVAIILLAFFISTVSTIDTSAQLKKQDLLNDFDTFHKIFEAANAGLYKHRSKEQVDSVFNANRNLIVDNTSYREFYNYVWNVIDFTGSSHNQLAFPDSLDKAISARYIFFPIPLKYIDNKLYTNKAFEKIPLGSEIISVNGIDATTFTKNISKYLSTDGFNISGKYAFLETDWLPFFIYLAYGEQSSFKIKYKTNASVRTIVIDPVNYKTAVNNYKSRYIPISQKLNKDDYSYRVLNANTALLTVNTFSLGGPKSEGHKAYASFLDSVFTDLQTKSIQHLIVDIRENGGGNDPNDLLLFSYLTKRNFRENASAHTLFNEVPLKKYFVEEEEGEIADLEEELKEEHNTLKDGKFYQNETFNPLWQPKQNAFQGKIYLLIGPFVASASSLFASMVKSDSRAALIGEETLGSYYGHTGHIPVTYRLPATKLLVTFSIVDLDQDVRQLPDQPYGRGVMPHHHVHQSLNDYLNNVDTVLEYAKQLASSEL